MHYLAHELRGDERPDLVEVFRSLAQKFDGAYNIVFLNAMGDMVVAPRPARASGRCATPRTARCSPPPARASPLQNLGFREHPVARAGRDDPDPGRRACAIDRFAEPRRPAHCFFEWIYFANVASTLDDRSVYLSRSRLGQGTGAAGDGARTACRSTRDTIVVPVPDTGKAAADAMAFALGMPSVEGLIRNRYIGRTFIEGANRADKARLKYTPLREVLQGKRVLLVEDTIVRSTTLQEPAARTCATAAGRRRSTSASPARRSSPRASTAST